MINRSLAWPFESKPNTSILLSEKIFWNAGSGIIPIVRNFTNHWARLYRDKYNDHLDASACFAKAATLPGAPGYDRRFSAYELSYCDGHEREAYEQLRGLYDEGEKERLPTLISRLKYLEEKLNIPIEQRIPDPDPLKR